MMDEAISKALAGLGKVEKLSAHEFGDDIVVRGFSNCDIKAIENFASEQIKEFSFRKSKAGHGNFAFKAVFAKTTPPKPIDNQP